MYWWFIMKTEKTSAYEYMWIYFYCYPVHVVELLSYYTNHCIYKKFIKFKH